MKRTRYTREVVAYPGGLRRVLKIDRLSDAVVVLLDDVEIVLFNQKALTKLYVVTKTKKNDA